MCTLLSIFNAMHFTLNLEEIDYSKDTFWSKCTLSVPIPFKRVLWLQPLWGSKLDPFLFQKVGVGTAARWYKCITVHIHRQLDKEDHPSRGDMDTAPGTLPGCSNSAPFLSGGRVRNGTQGMGLLTELHWVTWKLKNSNSCQVCVCVCVWVYVYMNQSHLPWWQQREQHLHLGVPWISHQHWSLRQVVHPLLMGATEGRFCSFLSCKITSPVISKRGTVC